MKAVGLYKYLPIDNPESLIDVEVPTPEAHGRDLLVRVRAVSVNPVDTKVRSPKEKVETEPKILGWDAAGVVEAVGSEVTSFKVGDEVYYAGSIIRPGCDAELHLVDERIVGRKPRSLSFAEAAAMPHSAPHDERELRPAERGEPAPGACPDRVRPDDRQAGARRDRVNEGVVAGRPQVAPTPFGERVSPAPPTNRV